MASLNLPAGPARHGIGDLSRNDSKTRRTTVDNRQVALHVVNLSSAPHNYTPHAQAAIAAAQSEAERLGSTVFGPKLLMQAILALPQCGAVKALERLGVSTEAMERGLQSLAGSIKAPLLGGYSRKYRSMVLLEFAAKAAQELRKPGFACVGTEHLLLGILNETDSTPAQVLEELGVTAKQLRRVIAESGGWPVGRD